MCSDMCMDMCSGMCSDMYIDMYIDMCIDMCIGMCTAMRMHMCQAGYDTAVRFALKKVPKPQGTSTHPWHLGAPDD